MPQTTLFLTLVLVLCILPQYTQAIPAIRIPTTNRPSIFSETQEYPLPNQGHVRVHDPNIIDHNDSFYLFKGGVHIPILKASSLSGPWEKIGTVLDGPSVIEKKNRTRPWAPTTIERDGRFYCFYTVSKGGMRNSAIGVASTSMDNFDSDGDGGVGSWTDHGALINTENGPLSHVYPYRVSNAIDASLITDQSTGQPYLMYGSFWAGIFQVPLADDLLSVADAEHPDSAQLVHLPDKEEKPQEGSFMSYHRPYYYLWFSHGKCCSFNQGFPHRGREYSIRVGRSKDVRGPFVDKSGQKLTKGGGTTVYGSNHGEVYAPGGIGVLQKTKDHPDIMYYHYLNTTVGFLHHEAVLGWNYIDYVDGWPVAKSTTNSGSHTRPNYTVNLMILMFVWILVWIYR